MGDFERIKYGIATIQQALQLIGHRSTAVHLDHLRYGQINFFANLNFFLKIQTRTN